MLRSSMILFAILAIGGGGDDGDDGATPDANTTALDSDPGAPDASSNVGLRREVVSPSPRLRRLAETLAIATFVVLVFTAAIAWC